MTVLKRNSNLEVLRIIAMCMIILIHFASAADIANLGVDGKFGRFVGASIVGICNMGVTCFCLISGYFGMKFSWKKLLKFEIMMIMFSLIETVVLVVAFPEQMQGSALLEQLVKSVFPFVSRKYWFYSCYICVFLFSGFIQKLIDTLKKEEFEKLLALLLIVFSVFPTIFYFEIMQDAGKGLVQMLMLYLIGRYIRLYKDVPVPKGKALLLFGALWLANTISIMHPVRLGSIVHSLCRDNSITNIAMAVILLYLFKNMKFSSCLVNAVTANMFAVFALENTLVQVVAGIVGSGKLNAGNPVLGMVLLVGIILLIFIVCALVGKVRELLFGKLEDGLIDKVLSVKYNKLDKR